MKTCKWTEDQDSGWFTSCDNAFTLIEGSPSDNQMRYCCFCGWPIKEILYVEDILDIEDQP